MCKIMDWDHIVGRILLGLSLIGTGIAIWMMIHGHGIWNTPAASDPGGMGFSGLGNVCIGGIWMLCGFLLVLIAGQGVVTGVIVEFLPREQWVEHNLDNVSVLTQEDESED